MIAGSVILNMFPNYSCMFVCFCIGSFIISHSKWDKEVSMLNF